LQRRTATASFTATSSLRKSNTRLFVKVLDFGIAKVLDAVDFRITRANDVLGSAPYMSPEQISGGDLDARADIFSMGCVLYQMLSGKRAFCEANREFTMLAIMQNKQPATLEQIPRGLWEIVRRAIAFDRDVRFANANEMRDALSAFSFRITQGGAVNSSAPAEAAAPAATTVAAGTDNHRTALDPYAATVFDDSNVQHTGSQSASRSAPARRTRRPAVVFGLVMSALIASAMVILPPRETRPYLGRHLRTLSVAKETLNRMQHASMTTSTEGSKASFQAATIAPARGVTSSASGLPSAGRRHLAVKALPDSRK
jgi:serine/threonine protein kinase